MSQNPTFDNILAVVFTTLDDVYRLHIPENPEAEGDPGKCTHCDVDFPCQTQDIIMNGMADAQQLLQAIRASESSVSEQPSA